MVDARRWSYGGLYHEGVIHIRLKVPVTVISARSCWRPVAVSIPIPIQPSPVLILIYSSALSHSSCFSSFLTSCPSPPLKTFNRIPSTAPRPSFTTTPALSGIAGRTKNPNPPSQLTYLNSLFRLSRVATRTLLTNSDPPLIERIIRT